MAHDHIRNAPAWIDAGGMAIYLHVHQVWMKILHMHEPLEYTPMRLRVALDVGAGQLSPCVETVSFYMGGRDVPWLRHAIVTEWSPIDVSGTPQVGDVALMWVHVGAGHDRPRGIE